MAFLNIFMTLNLERSIFRLIYDYKGQNEEGKFLGTIFIWIVFFASFVVFISMLFKDYISSIYESINFYPYFLIAIFTVYFNNFGNIPRVYLQVKEKAKTFVLLGIIQFIITNTGILFFVVYLEMKADGYLLGALISSIFMLPYFLWYTFKVIVLKFDRKIFFNVLKFSLPILPAVISAQIIDLSDRIFIEKFLSTTELGLYSLAYSLAAVVLVFSSSFKKAYDPYFYKIANTKNQIDAKYILKKTNTIYYIAVIFFCFSIALVSKEIISLFFNVQYFSSYKIVPIICLAYVIHKISGLINLSFYQNKNTVLMMNIAIASALLNLFLNFVLISKYGYFGAAYATLFTYLFMFIIKYIYSRNEFFIKINFNKILPFSLILISIYMILENFTASSFLIFIFKIMILIVILLFILFLEKKNIKEIKKYV